jgi:hypothetical protein
MKTLDLYVVLMAISLTTLSSLIPTVAADSISVMTDQPVHALGESVAITVVYMGGVHGDVKLSVEDSSGAVMNQWTWNHASADPFQQTVAYSPASPDTYSAKVLHRPHHMEPQASATTQVAFWSAQIVSLQYGNPIDAGKPVNIEATVRYYFTSPTQVKVELWSDSEAKMLGSLATAMNGQGTEAMTLENVQFTTVQDQDITARVYYQMPTAAWSHDGTTWSYSGKATVVPEFATTPALMLLLSLLSLLLIRKKTLTRRGI